MTLRARLRRAGVVAVALVIAQAILRPQLSSAFVTRGDELAFRGDMVRARAMYVRALAADAANSAAADRYAFSALLSHREAILRASLSTLDHAISLAPGDAVLRLDRALCEHALHRYAAAVGDFTYAGLRTRDARALTFAALDSARANRRAAVQLLREALRADPHFAPARHDLDKLLRRAP